MTASRFALGPLYVVALFGLPGAAGAPLFVATLASATDFVDGRLARRWGGASPAGAVLDVAADAVFVLCGLVALATLGLLSWLLPAAAATALAALGLRWYREPPRPGAGPRGIADRAGHWAGICNYGAVLVASGVPLGWVSPTWLPAASVAVALLNLAPLALRARRSTHRSDPS